MEVILSLYTHMNMYDRIVVISVKKIMDIKKDSATDSRIVLSDTQLYVIYGESYLNDENCELGFFYTKSQTKEI